MQQVQQQIGSASKVVKVLPDDLEFAKDVLTGTSLLQQRASDIRNQKINWQSYMQSQMISPEEMDFIIMLEQANSSQKNQILEKNPALCAKILISMMQHISKEQTIQYILTLLDDLLQEDKKRVEIFNDYAQNNQTTVWGPFLHMLNRKDGFIANQASRIIAKIACWSNQQIMQGPDLDYYLIWLKDQMKNPNNEYMQTVARCLQMLMTVKDYRKPFFELGGVQEIMNLLNKKVNFQIQYQFVFCLWCLSFDAQLAEKMSAYNIIPLLSEILIDSGKEKVTRITLGTLRHLLENPTSRDVVHSNCVSMIRCKVFKQLQLITSNKVDDPEMLSDIQYLAKTLQEAVHDLSTFDEYTSEVKSGFLEWSPVHKSQRFWNENIEKFNDKGFELVKILVQILKINLQPTFVADGKVSENTQVYGGEAGQSETSDSADKNVEKTFSNNGILRDRNTILAVACHDLGEYVGHYPPGKRIVERLGAKQLIMSLLTNRDPSVRYEALVALQKIMVHNWEYLGRQLDKENQISGSSANKTNTSNKNESDIVAAVNKGPGKAGKITT
ncbi:unnamed protein product [Gordionus sp. m RMFG-2023]|uniref:V-type proton ATPase subunit H-like n=1 Tax=Gordionus sp. m RMFG-2023 TaxID=3053472 RepID=UPI0030E5C1FA